MDDDPYLVLTRAVDVCHRLAAGGVACAIGGALALAFHVDQPRTTDDIDINVSVPASDARRVLALLPGDVPWNDTTVDTIERDEQVRIMWPAPTGPPLPLDLFFLASGFHELVRTRTETVVMLGEEVPILSATDLTVFKALFDRAKDWPDIESMLDAHDSTVDLDEAVRWVVAIVGPDDPRVARLRGLRPA